MGRGDLNVPGKKIPAYIPEQTCHAAGGGVDAIHYTLEVVFLFKDTLLLIPGHSSELLPTQTEPWLHWDDDRVHVHWGTPCASKEYQEAPPWGSKNWEMDIEVDGVTEVMMEWRLGPATTFGRTIPVAFLVTRPVTGSMGPPVLLASGKASERLCFGVRLLADSWVHTPGHSRPHPSKGTYPLLHRGQNLPKCGFMATWDHGYIWGKFLLYFSRVADFSGNNEAC